MLFCLMLQGKSRCVAPSFGLAGQAHAWLPDLTQLVEWIAAPMLEQQQWEEQQQQELEQQQQQQALSLAAVRAGNEITAATASAAAGGLSKVPLPVASPAKLQLQQSTELVDDASTTAAAAALAAAVAAYVDAGAAASAGTNADAGAEVVGSIWPDGTASDSAGAQADSCQTPAAAVAAAAATSAAPQPAVVGADGSNTAAVLQQQAANASIAATSKQPLEQPPPLQQQQQQQEEEEDLDVSLNACLDFRSDMPAAPASGTAAPAVNNDSSSSSRAPAELLLPGTVGSRDSSGCGGYAHGAGDSLDGTNGPGGGCYAAEQVRVKFSRFENSLFSGSGQDHGDSI
jgi:hypothetical protein